MRHACNMKTLLDLRPWGSAAIFTSTCFLIGCTATAEVQTLGTPKAANDLTAEPIINDATSKKTLAITNFFQVLDAESLVIWENYYLALESYADAPVELAAQIKPSGEKHQEVKETKDFRTLPPCIATAFSETGK